MLQGESIVRTPPGFFSDLDDKERIRLFNIGTIRALAEKELLFKKGSPDKIIYCVLNGALKVKSRDSDAVDFRFKAGDLISETSLSAGQGRISSVIAEEASAVFSLDPTAFATLGVETRTAILKRLHDTVLSRVDVLVKEKESAQFREAALRRYLKKYRQPLGKYEQSEIIVNIVKNIPRLPLHITQLIELLAGQRASAKEVAVLAKQDPSLVVDILKTINSPRYSLQSEISDVSYAITYLGFNEVYQIAISRGLMKSIPDSDEFREIYRHSLFLSYIASELCQSYDKNRAALLSTIGLLHDIGQTVLLLLQKQNPKWSLFIEMLDPGKLGAMLLKQWNIPKQVCQTIEYQAYPAFCPPAEIPSDQKVNIALLYVAHTVWDHLNNGPVDALDHPYLADYLRQLRFGPQDIDQIKNHILQGLRTKPFRLPDFVQKQLAVTRLSGAD
ncbi:MAG: HDOD domain-containing protein [Syntrophobacteraceae bacterium]